MTHRLDSAKRARHIFFVCCLVILADQVSKEVVARGHFPQTVNQGFSFGLGTGIGTGVLLALLSLVIFDSVKRGLRLPDLLIISGGFSNILDRFFHGGVIDWIRISSLWFNFADISITMGVAWIVMSGREQRIERKS